MSESLMDDNESVHSYDSNGSSSLQKEKLESIINMELKHLGVLCDLRSKYNLMKGDLENLQNFRQRFESQIRKKTESLEEKYDKLSEYQRNARSQLRKKLLSIMQNLEETNTSFCEAYEDYSLDVLSDTINHLTYESENLGKESMDFAENLKKLQIKGGIPQNLMKRKLGKTYNLEIVSNILLEISMRRPEIALEDTYTKLTDDIKKLEQRRRDLKTLLRK